MKIRGQLIGMACLLLVGGCSGGWGQYEDPNDAANISSNPDIMMRNIKDLRERLNERVRKGEITAEVRETKIKELTKTYVDLINPEDIKTENAWLFGDLFRDKGDWQKAYELFDIARKNPVDEDRRVNDQLRFARCAAHLGKVDEALEAAKSTFDASPSNKAPILPAILYEIVEEGKGKGKDLQLAELLEKAIEQHLETTVDPSTDAGKAFLVARKHHVEVAWSKVVSLFQAAGRTDLAKKAIQDADKIMAGFKQV